MNQPHAGKATLACLSQVLLDYRSDQGWGDGVQVKDVPDLQNDRALEGIFVQRQGRLVQRLGLGPLILDLAGPADGSPDLPHSAAHPVSSSLSAVGGYGALSAAEPCASSSSRADFI